MTSSTNAIRRACLSALAAILLGAVTAVLVVAFKTAVGLVETVSYGGAPTERNYHGLFLIAGPILGGLLAGFLTRRTFERRRQEHGVTQVIESVTSDDKEFPHSHVPVKTAGAVVSLGSGASLGPEDPAVEIGAGLSSWAHQRLGWTFVDVRTLIAAGGAAGITAAFHAPIAAFVFTLEVLRMRLASSAMGAVAIAIVASYAATLLILPDTALEIPGSQTERLTDFFWAALVGIAAGVAGSLLIRLSYGAQEGFARLRGIPAWTLPGIGGIVIGVAGIFYPELLGIGYGTMQYIIDGEIDGLGFLMLLAAGKLLLMAISFGSNFPGGFFAPSFFIGAAFGAACSEVAVTMFGSVVAPSTETLAAVGMAGIVAAVVRAPLTAALLVLAVTAGWGPLPLLVVGAVCAYITARHTSPASMYTFPLRDRCPQLTETSAYSKDLFRRYK